jgi:hypothetical protein
MKLSDQRLEEIRAWLCGDSKQDPSARQEEMAAIASELKQLRMRTSSASRPARLTAPPVNEAAPLGSRLPGVIYIYREMS